jgi:hypothetical protein
VSIFYWRGKLRLIEQPLYQSIVAIMSRVIESEYTTITSTLSFPDLTHCKLSTSPYLTIRDSSKSTPTSPYRNSIQHNEPKLYSYKVIQLYHPAIASKGRYLDLLNTHFFHYQFKLTILAVIMMTMTIQVIVGSKSSRIMGHLVTVSYTSFLWFSRREEGEGCRWFRSADLKPY